MKKNIRQEYFSIPNLMGYFRILLVPVYLFLYLRAENTGEYYAAAIVMVLSFLSDFLDGKIARKYHMVTEFGKILDPIADKITQGAMAISFAFRFPAMGILVLIFCLKEGILGAVGILMMSRGYHLGGARLHGKVCTAVLDLVMLLVLALPQLPYLAVNLLVCAAAGVMTASLALYLKLYWRAWKGILTSNEKTEKKQHRKVWILGGAAVVAVYLLAGALLPFAGHPQVQEATKESLNLANFYGEETSGERARIISDNGEALEERIRLISQAEEEIILSTFEFDADTSGKQILAALAEAAERGVKVSILVDGVPYMTAMWGNPYFLALARMENVEIRVYNPVRPWKPWGFMGRMHDKYLLVDDTAYILGGRNTYDYFLGDQPGYKNYDWDVLVYTQVAGEENSLIQVRDYFYSVWNLPQCRTLGKSFLWKNNPSVNRAQKELVNQGKTMHRETPGWYQAEDYSKTTFSVNRIQLVANPTHIFAKEPVVFYTITELMKQAREQVVFHTPYIICSDWMLERLKEICSQGNRVQMMTNSVANNGNPFGAMDYRKNKAKILDSGVEIMEYDGGISYHGKCFTVDNRISGVGSFNWDMRSAYLDTELMLVIDSQEVNQQLREEMQKYEEEALKVLDAERYQIPEGVTPRELTPEKEFRINFLEKVAGWARFLM